MNRSHITKANKALIQAINRNSRPAVEMAIADGANVNAEGGEPVLLAAAYGFTDILGVLIHHKADISRNSEEALYAAITNQQTDCARMLLQSGSNPNTGKGRCLVAAVKNNDMEAVDLLLKHGAAPALNRQESVIEAVKGGFDTLLRRLAKSKGVQISQSATEITTIAIEQNDAKTLEALFDLGIKPDMNDNYPLHHALEHNANDCLELVLQKLSLSQDDKNSLFNKSLLEKKENCALLMLEKGADAKSCSSLSLASQQGLTRVIKKIMPQFLKREDLSDAEFCREEMKKAVSQSIRYKKKEGLECLLEHGASLSKKPNEAIADALESNDLEMLHFIKAQNPPGDWLAGEHMDFALKKHKYESMRFLLDEGAPIPSEKKLHQFDSTHLTFQQVKMWKNAKAIISYEGALKANTLEELRQRPREEFDTELLLAARGNRFNAVIDLLKREGSVLTRDDFLSRDREENTLIRILAAKEQLHLLEDADLWRNREKELKEMIALIPPRFKKNTNLEKVLSHMRSQTLRKYKPNKRPKI